MSDYITEDTLVLIFKRLPVKSLLRLRSVCKGWNELIDSPFFIQEHLSVQKSHFILQNEGTPLKNCLVVDLNPPTINPLHSPIENKQLLLCGTHQGLVCLLDESKEVKGPNKLLVWNPSIRKSLVVLIPGYLRYWACDEGLNWFGFWVDSCTKEYKFIVLILLVEQENLDEGDDRAILGIDALLYSSARPETHDWLPIKSPEEGIKNVVLNPPVMVQGVAHWAGYKYENNARIILSFDFSLEKFDTIDIPDHLQHASTQPIHCHWQSKLSLMAEDLKTRGNYNLFARQEEAWIKMFSFKFYPDFGKVCWMLGEQEKLTVLSGNLAQWCFCVNRDGFINLPQNVHVAYDFVESLLFP